MSGGEASGVTPVRCGRCGRESTLPPPLGMTLKRCARCQRMVCSRCAASGWWGGQVVCKGCAVVRSGGPVGVAGGKG